MLQFEFDGHSSNEYGIIVTAITDNDNLESRTLQLGEKNRYRVRENHFGTVYEGNYSFTISIMKNPCLSVNIEPESTNNSYYLSSDDVRIINGWLTSPQTPRLLKITGGDYFCENIEFFATFTEVNTDHVISPFEMNFTVTCDSPYGYTPEIIHTITSSSTLTKTYTINNTSDCYEDYIYPLIKISPKSHGSITLQNATDNNGTMKINALKNDEFYIDCQRLKIYDITNSLISFEDLGVNDIDNIYWLRLVHGENVLNFTGDASFEIVYREPRKVGVFA